MTSLKRSAIVLLLVLLWLPVTASAHRGDLASEILARHSLFRLHLIETGALERLGAVLDTAKGSGFTVKVALIAAPADLVTSREFYGKPQRYAEHLGLELSAEYRDAVFVVMPSGFGWAVDGKPDPRLARVLAGLSPPGHDPTKQAEVATAALRTLAAAAGHPIAEAGGSQTRDRLTIAAAATAGIALFAGIVLYRRRRRTL